MSREVKRLEEMEVRLTFLDDAVAALSDADVDMGRRLLEVERMLKALREELDALRVSGQHDVRSEPPPPHY